MVRKARGKEVVEPVPVGAAGILAQAAQVIDDSLDGSMLGTGDEGNALFASVKKGRAALQSVVDEWIESYRQDRNTATLELLQFFSLASGCKGKITPQMKETMDNGRIIRELVEEFDDQAGGDYPIITNGPQWKKFRSNFCEFVHTLIRQCQYSIIYDQYLMENMISFLITLSDSQVRAFRHTATLAAMKLMTALVDVALTLSINIDNTQRQYDKARLEKSRGDKLDGLVVKRQELDDNMEDIKTMLGYLFKSIFVHRYRDIIPEIRALCMYEIGIWMKRFPNYFLDDSFLKYVGWTLHDKVGDVRLKCLQSLLPLYETEEIARKMELFTNKFKERIVAMSLDKEYEVAVQAVKLIISIHKYHREVLTDKDCEHVYELVYATHRSVAQAAGEFLNEKLFQVDEEATANLCSRRGKKRSVHTPLIRDLITFFIESELHEHCAYLVDSLIESHPMMKDWECMTDLLLEEENSSDEFLGEKQESVLIDLMSCAVKQTATGEPPLDRIKKSKISAKDIATLNEEKERISIHFASVIPDLLRKYKTDSAKIIDLLEIPLNFVKNTYSQNSDDLEKLLAVVSELIEIHSESEVIESCARIYDFMQDENFSQYRLVRVEVSTLLDTLLQRYKKSFDCLCEGADDELETISFTTKKIVPVVACCHQMDTDEIWNLFFEKWIKDFKSIEESNKFADEAIKYSISVCYYALMWELHTLSAARNQGPVDHYTRNHLIEFISELRDTLTHPNEDLAQEAYFSICDLLLMFDHQLENDSPAVAQLVYRPNNTLIKQLETFIVERVFVYDEESEDEPGIQNSVERLYKKRHLLAGYCKLIIYNVIPMRHAICVIRHYVRFFNDFGDIIKTTLGKLREMNKVICAKTMAAALIQVFKELQLESHQNPNAFTKQDENFLALKELAKRFALSFGLDNQKNRDAVASLHREGIHFSFDKLDNPIDPLGPPPNLPFLEVLNEFSHKIFKQDKKTVLTYLDKCVQSAGIDVDEWQSLVLYRNSLAQLNEFDISLNRSRTRARKRAVNVDDDASEYETPVKRVRKRYVSFSVSNIENSSTMD